MSKKKLSQTLLMLMCRAYGHRWDDRGWQAMIRKGVRGWDQLFTCDRCTTSRNDFRARSTLVLLHRNYDYPSDYPGNVYPAEALKILVQNDVKEAA